MCSALVALGLECHHLLITSAVTVIFILAWFRNLCFNNVMPTPPRNYPLIGHMLQFLRPDYHRVLLSFADQLGPVYSFK